MSLKSTLTTLSLRNAGICSDFFIRFLLPPVTRPQQEMILSRNAYGAGAVMRSRASGANSLYLVMH